MPPQETPPPNDLLTLPCPHHLREALPYVLQRPRGPTLDRRSRDLLSVRVVLRNGRLIVQAIKSGARQRRRICQSHHRLEGGKNARFLRQETVVA